jgi:hypothetical protein
MTEQLGKHVGNTMKISKVELFDYTGDESFAFENLSNFKFGGVYIIYSIDKDDNREIVKIGESNFIFRRIANYLTPLEEKDKANKSKITKRTIQSEIQKGLSKNLSYKIIWKVVEDITERKQLEKDLLQEFKQKNNNERPVMNRCDK